MQLIDQYISYIKSVRRYSQRTVTLYTGVLEEYAAKVSAHTDAELLASLNVSEIRSYQVHIMDKRKLSPKTVSLHMSVLSSFCRYLIKKSYIKSNPVSLVTRPRLQKRLPEFYRAESMESYFTSTDFLVGREDLEAFLQDSSSDAAKKSYEKRLARLIIHILYSLGIRRSEMIGLTLGSFRRGTDICC